MTFFRVSTWDMARGSYTISPAEEWTTDVKPPYLLLVHGYNNTVTEANQKYLPFAGRFHDSTTAGLYWENSKSYLHSRFVMKDGSLSLLKFLCRDFTVAESRQLTIVAHSMGCRLVLDCLTRLTHSTAAPALRPKNVVL